VTERHPSGVKEGFPRFAQAGGVGEAIGQMLPSAVGVAVVARNNSVIMAVLLLIIGVKLIGDAITGFST
jgi:hypothetical protein